MGVEYDIPKPSADRPQRKTNYAPLIPLFYAPLLPLLRIGLRGRVSPQMRDRIFVGTVLTALAHAGYQMGKDSSMAAGT